jgi:hypothetical protein
MCTRQVQINLFWGCFAQNFNEEGCETKTEQHLIYCTESTMKEFDEHLWRAIWLDIRGCWENSSRFQIKINTECLANIIVLDLVRHET